MFVTICLIIFTILLSISLQDKFWWNSCMYVCMYVCYYNALLRLWSNSTPYIILLVALLSCHLYGRISFELCIYACLCTCQNTKSGITMYKFHSLVKA